MSSIRTMRMSDLLRLTTTNLDPFTETYNIGFYLEYLTKWPDLCRVIEGADGEIEGYSAFPTLRHISFTIQLTPLPAQSPR